MAIGQANDLSGSITMSSSAGPFRIVTSNSNRLTVLQDGNVGIGITTPNDGKLQVYANSSSDWGTYIYNQNANGIGLHVETNSFGTEPLLRLSSLTGSGGSNTVRMLVRADGKVGIGVASTPGRMLEVNGGTTNDGGIKLKTSSTASNFWSGVEFANTFTSSFLFVTADDSSGTFKFFPAGTLKATIDGAGTWLGAGDVIAYGSPSDKRLKENIKPIESALDKVMKLEGVTFDWIQKEDQILDIKEDIGFIAQDVKKVIPELVRENENGMLSMRHQGIAPILLEAIKELKQEIEELKNKPCNCNCK